MYGDLNPRAVPPIEIARRLTNRHPALVSADDPYWDSVVSLLHFDGLDGSNSFPDVKGKAWTAYGDAKINSAAAVLGNGSGAFDGNGDYIQTPATTDFSFGAGDFTIECFAKIAAATPTEQFLICLRNQSLAAEGCVLALISGKVSFSNGAVWLSSPNNAAIGVWQHLAVCRTAGVTRIFEAGRLKLQTIDSTNFGGPRTGYIARSDHPSIPAHFAGGLDEVRITKGIGRYEEDFDPPVQEFPNSGGS